jgi:hypothetical protein
MPTWEYIKIHTLQAEKKMNSRGCGDSKEKMTIRTAQTMAGHGYEDRRGVAIHIQNSKKGVKW